MTEFMQFILDLFGKHHYDILSSPDLKTTKFFKLQDIDDYWCVSEGLETYEKQAELYKWFKSKLGKQHPVAEKNISLLLLVDTDKQQGEYDQVEIENDDLFFKKYVLPYTEGDFQVLKEKIKNSGYGTFESLIMKDDSFKAVGKGEGYATLLYTIVHKLPFIPIQVERQQVEQQTFAFRTTEIANLFDKLNDLPVDINSEEASKFINNYLNADNNEEH